MITKGIFITMMIFNMVLSAILVIAFDGFLLYLKGVRLLNDKFNEMTEYEVFSFHIFEVTRIGIVVLGITVFLIFKQL